MHGRTISNHYRCPECFSGVVPSGPLSRSQGYFKFGPGSVCYGRLSAGSHRPHSAFSLEDVSPHASFDGANLRLPFDPGEIIDNLRLERYRPGLFTKAEYALKRIYYWLRPWTNQFVRREIQRFHARRWKRQMFPRWPVDTTVENIHETVLQLLLQAHGLERIPFVWFWPNGARGCLSVTHDVETQAGRDFCGALMDLDDAFGLKASFQLIPEQRYGVPDEFLQQIRDRGFEVGIQDMNHDGRLFDEKEEFLRRARIVNHYGRRYGARGFRAGVLYRRPDWYDALDFSFDMSIPNVAHLDPQRGGCCTVMPFFIGNMLELPVTTTQDYTLFHLLRERSLDLWKAQMDLILEKNGLVTFIVHPDYVIAKPFRRVYEDLLRYVQGRCKCEPIWTALPSDIDHWWRARSRMSLVPDNGSWRIEGADAERAVVAYAKGVGGRLVYEVPQSAAWAAPFAGAAGRGGLVSSCTLRQGGSQS